MLQRVKFVLLITFAEIALESYFLVNSVKMIPYMYVSSFKSVALREPTQVETKNSIFALRNTFRGLNTNMGACKVFV